LGERCADIDRGGSAQRLVLRVVHVVSRIRVRALG
jgi:hypothetical protein